MKQLKFKEKQLVIDKNTLKVGAVVSQLNSEPDYVVEFDDGKVKTFFEHEIESFKDSVTEFQSGEKVVIRGTGEEGEITHIDYKHKQASILFKDASFKVHNFSELEKLCKFEILSRNEGEKTLVNQGFKIGDEAIVIVDDCKGMKVELVGETDVKGEFLVQGEDGGAYYFEAHEMEKIEDSNDTQGKFQTIANNIGSFTDEKNKQYGSSVDATYEMVKVLMDRYTYDERQYLIPKELLQHLLLTVRVMDKQNRIFNNPSGEGDSESPWKDITGYGLIGVEMVERQK